MTEILFGIEWLHDMHYHLSNNSFCNTNFKLLWGMRGAGGGDFLPSKKTFYDVIVKDMMSSLGITSLKWLLKGEHSDLSILSFLAKKYQAHWWIWAPGNVMGGPPTNKGFLEGGEKIQKVTLCSSKGSGPLSRANFLGTFFVGRKCFCSTKKRQLHHYLYVLF